MAGGCVTTPLVHDWRTVEVDFLCFLNLVMLLDKIVGNIESIAQGESARVLLALVA